MSRNAVFFDIDGTLIPGTSCEKVFVKYLMDTGILRFGDIFRFINGILANLPKGCKRAVRENRYYLKGKEVDMIVETARKVFDERLDSLVTEAARERINRHRKNGDR